MKKYLLILPLITLLWSCKKQNETVPAVTGSATTKSKPKAASAGDGHYDLLGYGYDVTGEYATSASATYQILNIKQIIADYPSRVDSGKDRVSYTGVYSGYSSEQFTQKLMNKVGLGATKKALFSATINATFRDTLSSFSQYVYSDYSIYVQQRRLKINAPISLLQSYLMPDFVTDLNTQTPDYIVSHYGTHVLIDIMIGGTLDISYRAETRNKSRESASAIGIKASITKVFSAAVMDSTSSSTSLISKNFNETLVARTHGGDPSQAMFSVIPLNNSNGSSPSQTLQITPWQNSVTLANSNLIDIGPSGLVMLSDLVTDPSKKAALENYINQYMAARVLVLHPAPIYEFYNSSAAKHAYNIDSNFPTYNPSYPYNGQPFKAFASPLIAGTVVPVYQYYNPSSQDHVLTTNANANYSGYNNDGVMFYASTQPISGTVPCYEFYSSSVHNHFYSTNRNANSGYPYIYNGQPFYVFPN